MTPMPMPMRIPTNVKKIPMLKDFNKFFILTLRFISHQYFNLLLFVFPDQVVKKNGIYSEFANNHSEAKRAFSYSSILHKAASSSGTERLCYLPRSTKSPITFFPSVLRPLSMSAKRKIPPRNNFDISSQTKLIRKDDG